MEEKIQCGCMCHLTGVPQILTSNPSQCCCKCELFDDFSMRTRRATPEEQCKIELDQTLLERIESLEKNEEIHCDAILRLEELVKKLEEQIKMEDRVTASDVLLRLEVLEEESKFYSDRKEMKTYYINLYRSPNDLMEAVVYGYEQAATENHNAIGFIKTIEVQL